MQPAKSIPSPSNTTQLSQKWLTVSGNDCTDNRHVPGIREDSSTNKQQGKGWNARLVLFPHSSADTQKFALGLYLSSQHCPQALLGSMQIMEQNTSTKAPVSSCLSVRSSVYFSECWLQLGRRCIDPIAGGEGKCVSEGLALKTITTCVRRPGAEDNHLARLFVF